MQTGALCGHPPSDHATHPPSTARSRPRLQTGQTTRGGCPSGRVFSSRRAKWRCRVRSSGAHLPWARQGLPRPAPPRELAPPSSVRPPTQARRSACGGRPGADWAPARQTRRRATSGSSDRCSPVILPPARAERTGVLARRQFPHHCAPLLGADPRVRRLADQRIPKQRNCPRPFSTDLLFVSTCSVMASGHQFLLAFVVIPVPRESLVSRRCPRASRVGRLDRAAC